MAFSFRRELNLTGTKQDYFNSQRWKKTFIVLFILLAIIAFSISITVGFYNASVIECYETIWNHLTGNIVNTQADNIIWGSRLPIAIFAIVCGAALSIGGAVMQSILRNPLADPYMMGISSGASLGVALSIIAGVTIGTSISSTVSQVIMAFIFSLIPVAVILLFSFKRRTTPTKLILIGVAVSYVFSACTTLLMLAADEQSLSDVYSWNVGSLATISWDSLPIPITVTVIGIAVLMLLGNKINVMMSGENVAHSLGINTHRMTIVLMVIVALMTAAVVSFCGTIGFIGLVGPHIARIFVGSNSRYLLPASAAFGGAFLLIANSIASVAGTAGLPVGVVSALIGCPIFIVILFKTKKKEWT